MIANRTAIETVARAADLPPTWDRLCDTMLQHRSLLRHYEATNPCRQRYYCLFENERLAAGAIVYSITQNLLTFLGDIPSPVRLNVVGLPASISPPGLIGDARPTRRLLDAIFSTESGIVLAMNLEPDCRIAGVASMRLLPDMVFYNHNGSFADYRDALRASWRRRLRRTQERFAEVETVRQTCRAFTPGHYALYREVLAHSTTRMETLALDFFRGLPPPIELVSCYRGGDLLCWRIVLFESGKLSYVLGGHDYALSGRFDAYFNNLYGLLADGMECGARTIDMGQTAEDPKARTGARAVEKRMLMGHRNPLCGGLIRMCAPLFAYRGRVPEYHVFRTGGPRS